MNKRKVHQILSRLLLLFFVVGQIIIYAHQHHSKYHTLIVGSPHSADKHTVVQEKCTFCDQMHHAPINCVQKPDYCTVLTAIARIYISKQYHYKGNSLIHADGLSPPVLV
ncbi:hypothetical protein [Mucilaginibacter arboris]|uniref:Uncharacterized protein n=1 Tax=Mucilaginibacter arboris TaxID=2682090 RepID=A0A7K1SS67_9SPHI|nr:hypothetical protein [Mucilaginibacter arboris]MVN20156.1 hypothetical protein [Mucilaginibacter arboris]